MAVAVDAEAEVVLAAVVDVVHCSCLLLALPDDDDREDIDSPSAVRSPDALVDWEFLLPMSESGLLPLLAAAVFELPAVCSCLSVADPLLSGELEEDDFDVDFLSRLAPMEAATVGASFLLLSVTVTVATGSVSLSLVLGSLSFVVLDTGDGAMVMTWSEESSGERQDGL